MKNIMKRGLTFVLMLIMVASLLPMTTFAAVDSSGKPTDLNNTVVLSIYTPEGSFPGEPAMHGSADYISFNSKFAKTSASGKFKDNATTELKVEILEDLVQGASSGNNTVWGVFSADGLKEKYFKSDASIIQPENEAAIIRVIKGNAVKNMSDDEILRDYEIVWYVIKLQHSPSNSWWSKGTTEWHIDGLIREKDEQLITINYYGNGNTEGSAPDGITDHPAGTDYTVLAGNNMKRKVNGVYVNFLGWSAKADGTGEEQGFYQPGAVINPTKNISLYAMWDTTTQHTATVNTYLDNVLTSDTDIHGTGRDLYLSADAEHYHKLTEGNTGVYSTKITGNGKFHLYVKNADGTYTQIGTHQLTIYNQNGSLDVHHYSVTYDANGGTFAADPGKKAYNYGEAITAVTGEPTQAGYRFLGWKDNQGNLIQPGQEVTASITAPIVLTAQWEKTVNVTVNVTINHAGGGGYDQAPEMDHVTLTVASKADDKAPYLEVGQTLNLTKTSHSGFQYSKDGNVTKYEGYTLTDMPGGTAEYTAVTSKSGYDTTVEHHKDDDGNWVINIEMIYNPTNFDVRFDVRVDESVPDAYLPDAAIVKVTFWAAGKSCWEIITQQAGGEPGVRVDIDPTTRTGSGSYPVWKYESNGESPYGYRVEVTSFVYPDGTIVPVSKVLEQDVQWTDNVYTATMEEVTGGALYGTLDGAYYDKPTDSQKGKLNVVITMDLHNVTFDAQGGTVNGRDKQLVEQQYKIPGFKNYMPTREGGYIFDGWYEDAAYTIPATEGKDLTEDITLYAKWRAPLTISGTVSISGTYQQNGETVSVHDIDRATEAVVVLQEIRNGTVYDLDSQTVSFGSYKDAGRADYSFTKIPNEGKNYQIHVLVLNYGTGYDNESDADSVFTAGEFTAVFGDDTTADVDAHLEFVPPSYDQILKVDATQIGNGFRPDSVLSEVMYRDTGDNHPFQRISQHDVEPYGVQIAVYNGKGSGTQSIWKWHTDGTLYDYQMNITQVNGEPYNSDTAPFYITYAEAAYWNENTNAPSGELKATLIPKTYPVIFDLNAGDDNEKVKGMDAFAVGEEEGYADATYAYKDGHTWSHTTEFEYPIPEREGYTFKGWKAEVTGVTVGDKMVTIADSVAQEVVLTAQWELIIYDVTVTAKPVEGGTVSGASGYAYGTPATIQAYTNEGFTFNGWYENDKLVTRNETYTFDVYAAHNFVAKFSKNQYTVYTRVLPENGGTVSGGGTYDYDEEITLSATANPGYRFVEWRDVDSNRVNAEPSFTIKVTETVTYVAYFEQCEYDVTVAADPKEGGTAQGTATYPYGETATVSATANEGYAFTGWYKDNTEVSTDARYQFTVTENTSLEARFEQISYQVTAEAEYGGTAQGTATYYYGVIATVTATPDNSYTFEGWFVGDECVSKELEYTFTVTSHRTLTARFSKYGFRVEATPNQKDVGTTTGTGDYDQGESATVTATPAEGYAFRGWYEGTEKVSDTPSYTFTVQSNRNLVAHFAQVYTITTEATPQGAGNLTGGGQYEPANVVTLSASANPGYYFVGWYDGSELVTTDYSFEHFVEADKTFTAVFERKVSYKCDYVYLFGYTDTEIGAEGTLLRGELAQMIYRLVRQNGTSKTNGEVVPGTAGEWFESGMTYMNEVGAIGPYNTNPYASVTCGETYKMICLGLKFTKDATLDYSDYKAILTNSGMPAYDSVTSTISRWKFCELFNAILGRSNYCLEGFFDTTGKEVTAADYGYQDLSSEDSYYRIMMIATSTFDSYGRIDLVHRMERNYHDYTDPNY